MVEPFFADTITKWHGMTNPIVAFNPKEPIGDLEELVIGRQLETKERAHGYCQENSKNGYKWHP